MAKSDMQRALEDAKLAKFPEQPKGGSKVARTCRCGNPITRPGANECYQCFQKTKAAGVNRGPASSPQLPKDYLQGGYFENDGYIMENLLDKTARELAEIFAGTTLTQHQIRAFFGHARDVEQQLKLTKTYRAAVSSIRRLEALALDRAARKSNALPQVFADFICRNVHAVRNEKDFLQGFIPHFEHVVGLSAPFLKRR